MCGLKRRRTIFSSASALEKNKGGICRRLAFVVSHPSSKRRSMDGAQFDLSLVGDAGGGLKGTSIERASKGNLVKGEVKQKWRSR